VAESPTASLPQPPDFAAADETASELIRLWNAGEQFFGEAMKRQIIGLALAYDALRAEAHLG
jgi:hypothetical protein